MAYVTLDKWETEDLSKPFPYTVRLLITASHGISPALFVMNLKDVYQDIASAKDIERYPVSPLEASPEPGYYRASEASVSFQRKLDLRTFVETVRLRLKETCSEWTGESSVDLVPQSYETIEGV